MTIFHIQTIGARHGIPHPRALFAR